MTKIDQEFLAAMMGYIPPYLAKHQVRMYAQPHDAEPMTLESAVQELPRNILRQQLPVDYSNILINSVIEELQQSLAPVVLNYPLARSPLDALAARTLSVYVCTLMQDHHFGFKFPDVPSSFHAVNIESDWLVGEGRAFYQYCLANGLSPYFEPLCTHIDKRKSVRMMVRWKSRRFDKMLGLPSHPLFAHRYKLVLASQSRDWWEQDIEQLRDLSDTSVILRKRLGSQMLSDHEQGLDEESDRIVSGFALKAQQMIENIAVRGGRQANIFIGREGAGPIKSFGKVTSLILNECDQDQVYKLFDRPLCFDSMVIRGLCRLSRRKGFALQFAMQDTLPWAPRHLSLDVLW